MDLVCQPNEKGTLCLDLDLNCPIADTFEAEFESSMKAAKCEQGTRAPEHFGCMCTETPIGNAPEKQTKTRTKCKEGRKRGRRVGGGTAEARAARRCTCVTPAFRDDKQGCEAKAGLSHAARSCHKNPSEAQSTLIIRAANGDGYWKDGLLPLRT